VPQKRQCGKQNKASRKINNCNLWRMREHNITSTSLLKRVGMQTMASYLARTTTTHCHGLATSPECIHHAPQSNCSWQSL
jgi:hypothetical protein